MNNSHPPPHNPFGYLAIAVLCALLLGALVCRSSAQDMSLPAATPQTPPAPTVNSNPKTLYCQWYDVGRYLFDASKYWQADALASRAKLADLTNKVNDLTAKLASAPTLQQIATDVASIKGAIAGLGGTKITLTSASSAIKVAWDAVPNATGYRVERSTDGINFAQIGGDITGLSYVDTNLPPATYWYRVRAYNATAVSPYSNVASYAFAQ